MNSHQSRAAAVTRMDGPPDSVAVVPQNKIDDAHANTCPAACEKQPETFLHCALTLDESFNHVEEAFFNLCSV